MSSNNDGPKKGSDKPAGDTGQAKRPHATLDLKATVVEVKGSGDGDKTAATSAQGKDPGKPDTKTASGPTGPTAGAATSKPAENKPTGAAPAGPAKPAAKPEPVATAKPAGGSAIGRTFTHLVAGGVGGILALLGAPFAADQFGIQIAPQGPSLPPAEVQRRLQAVEAAVKRPAAAVPAAVADKLAGLERQTARLDEIAKSVDALATAQKKLTEDTRATAERLAKSGSALPTDASARIARLEETLASLAAIAKAEPDSAGRLPQLAQLSGRLADLESAIATRLQGLRRDMAQEIDQRLTAAREAAEAARSGTTRIDREITAVRSDSAKLGQRFEALKAAGDRNVETLRALREEAGSLRAAIEALKGDLEGRLKTTAKQDDVKAAIAPVAARLQSFEAGLKRVLQREGDRQATAERIVLALELNNLRRAMDRGQGFEPELAAVRKVAGGKLDLSVLDRYQAQGVPTLAKLQSEFPGVATAVLDAEHDPKGGTVVDRLMAGARSIVRVRRTDHAPDDASSEAVLGRMERLLKAGDIDRALKEAGKLPAKSRAAADAWLKKAEARRSVDRAIATIEATLKSSLASTKPGTEKGQK
ncbi:MAG: mitofilin family membrane protein [Hyphomicrobiaceae bacterium]